MFWQRRQLLLSAGAFVALLAGALFFAQHSIDQLLYRDAVSTGHGWARYLARQIKDFDRIVAGERPSPQSLEFFRQAQRVGQVFRYKIFDPEGRLRLVSDDLRFSNAAVAKNLAEYNGAAARALAESRPHVVAREGTLPEGPAYFAEAYVPVVVDGRAVALVQTNIDQTEKREYYRSTMIYAAISIGLMMAFAFGISAFAWYRRTQEKMRADEHIRFLGHHDPMTQLPNRWYLVERMHLALADLPARGTGLALHCIDLDRLKDVNNRLGRDGGDLLLRAVAERLRSVVSPGDMVARLGSDGFGVLQSNVTSIAAAEALVRNIRNELAKPYLIRDSEVTITASVGVALAPAHGNEAMRLLKCAELALDKGKLNGRNFARFFMPDMVAEIEERTELERAIREAITQEKFDLHFQPLFNLRSGRLTGLEALLRLPAHRDGFVPPSVFIPLAEEMGLIDQVGYWVIRRACRTAVNWPEHLAVAVNLSPAHFLAGNVSQVIEEALAECRLDPRRLEIEITENMLLSDTDAVLRELKRIKALGVKIVMDDFGKGYSSLSYLWRFPFDAIKIDGVFMQGLETGDRNVENIVSTIVTLGRSLDLTVTAEGVENEKQLEFLRRIDCDQVQGFLFGQPVPTTEVAAAILADYLPTMPAGLVPSAPTRRRGAIARVN